MKHSPVTMHLDWSTLPEEICVKIFHELSYVDRFNAALVCKRWHNSLKSRRLWFDVVVTFKGDHDKSLLVVAKNYGEYIAQLNIQCYQQEDKNCENACLFMETLLKHKKLRIETFKLEFCEQNPLFYSGNLFIDTLKRFFLHSSIKKPIKRIDLSKFPIAFDDDVLNAITQNHSNGIEFLNIQNKILTYRVSSHCVANFVTKATHLKWLHLPYSCFESETLRQIARKDGANKLRFLSLTFKRVDKFFKCLTVDDWNLIRESLPDLRIELHFDPTYPLQSTFKIMVPEVPVSSLKLYFQCNVNDEQINLASMINKQTLRVLEVTSTPSAGLDNAILRVVKECESLECIHVWCQMSRNTVDEILKMKKFRQYTLPCDEVQLV